MSEAKPIGCLASVIVAGCSDACRRCSGFTGKGGNCPGLCPQKADAVPLCHVDAETGRMESPLDAAGRLLPGQERFWKLL